MPNLQIALIAFTSASSGKQIESYYSTFCVIMRAAFNLTGDEKNSEFVTAYCCNILLKKMIDLLWKQSNQQYNYNAQK